MTKKTNHAAHHTAHHSHKDPQEAAAVEGAVAVAAPEAAEGAGAPAEPSPEAAPEKLDLPAAAEAVSSGDEGGALRTTTGEAVPPGSGDKLEGVDAGKLAVQLEKYRAELLEVRTQLRERESELALSQKLSQETVQKLKDEHELRVRAAADMENYRKRITKEREDTAKFGQERLVKNLLPVLDNLERALDPKNSADPTALRQGVEMTRRLFEKTLGDIGVTGFSAVGKPFDPACHEAMQAVESDEAPGTVVAEMVRGFMMHDRLIRPAMVFVAKARAPSEGHSDPGKTVGSSAAGEEVPSEGPEGQA